MIKLYRLTTQSNLVLNCFVSGRAVELQWVSLRPGQAFVGPELYPQIKEIFWKNEMTIISWKEVKDTDKPEFLSAKKIRQITVIEAEIFGAIEDETIFYNLYEWETLSNILRKIFSQVFFEEPWKIIGSYAASKGDESKFILTPR